MAKVLIQRELKKYEVDVKAIEQSIVFTHDPNDFLVNGMLELLDQYYRLEKSFSTKNNISLDSYKYNRYTSY